MNRYALFENIPVATCVIDLKWKIKYTNASFLELIDSSPEDELIADWLNYIFYSNSERVLKVWHKALTQLKIDDKNSKERYYRISTSSNKTKYISISVSSYGNEFIVCINDITKFILAQRIHISIADSQLKLVNTLANHFYGAFVLFNENLTTKLCNKEYEKISDDNKLDILELCKLQLKDQSAKAFTNIKKKYKLNSGAEAHFLFSGSVIKIGNSIKYAIYGMNISHKIAAQNRVLQERAFYERLINVSPALIYIIELNSVKMEYVNESGLKNIGYTSDDFGFELLKGFGSRFKEEERNLLLDNLETVSKLKDGEVNVIEYSLNTKNKGWRTMRAHSSVFKRDEVGNVTHYAGYANDVTELRRLEQERYMSAINAEETERERVAKELHDGLGPIMSTCRIYLHNLKLSSTNDNSKDSINNLEELIAEALTNIKEMSNNLSPHILRNFGVFHAVKSFVDKINFTCDVNISNEYTPETRFTELVEISVYRVINELINNSVKYSKAENINIKFNKGDNEFLVLYSDDGIGFEFSKVLKEQKGFGLTNIHSRIHNIGGNIDFKSSPGCGVQVTVSIPNEKSLIHD